MLTDVDGHEYIDLVCALGAISLGYGECVLSAREQLDLWGGGLFSLPAEAEAEAARAVLETVAPWASRVRFTKTGSEATHAAMRIAKLATGRPYVMAGDWAYHGWHEWACPGQDARTLRYPYDPSTLAELVLDRSCDVAGALPERDVAAVFVEPHRWEVMNTDWLRGVRAWCTENGAPMVMDEMVYGGRWAKGGGTDFFGVQPDLACYGKAIGNGASIACVVGQADVMDAHAEAVSGTYSGDVVALRQMITTLGWYQHEDIIGALWARGRQLQAGLKLLVDQCALNLGSVFVEGYPVHQRLRFAEPARGHIFSREMAQRGILWHPEVTNVMAAHRPDHIEAVLVAAAESLPIALAESL